MGVGPIRYVVQQLSKSASKAGSKQARHQGPRRSAPRIEPLAQGLPGKVGHRQLTVNRGQLQPLMKRSGQIDCEPDAGFPIGSSWSRGRGRRWRWGLGGRCCRGIPPNEGGGIGGEQGLTGGHG